MHCTGQRQLCANWTKKQKAKKEICVKSLSVSLSVEKLGCDAFGETILAGFPVAGAPVVVFQFYLTIKPSFGSSSLSKINSSTYAAKKVSAA